MRNCRDGHEDHGAPTLTATRAGSCRARCAVPCDQTIVSYDSSRSTRPSFRCANSKGGLPAPLYPNGIASYDLRSSRLIFWALVTHHPNRSSVTDYSRESLQNPFTRYSATNLRSSRSAPAAGAHKPRRWRPPAHAFPARRKKPRQAVFPRSCAAGARRCFPCAH